MNRLQEEPTAEVHSNRKGNSFFLHGADTHPQNPQKGGVGLLCVVTDIQ
jgi:hypothetical protein